MDIKELLYFNKLFASELILWLYRIALVLGLIGWIFSAFGAMSFSVAQGVIMLFFTPAIILGIRILFELYYVLFGVFDQLKEINSKLEKK